MNVLIFFIPCHTILLYLDVRVSVCHLSVRIAFPDDVNEYINITGFSPNEAKPGMCIDIVSDLIIPGLVTNRTAKICCRCLILALFYSTMVIKKYFG